MERQRHVQKTRGNAQRSVVYSLCMYRTDYTHVDTHTCVLVCVYNAAIRRTIYNLQVRRTEYYYVLLCKYVLSWAEKHGHANTRIFYFSFTLSLSVSLSSRHTINGSQDIASNNYRYLKKKKKVMQAVMTIVDRRRSIEGPRVRI